MNDHADLCIEMPRVKHSIRQNGSVPDAQSDVPCVGPGSARGKPSTEQAILVPAMGPNFANLAQRDLLLRAGLGQDP